MNYFQNSFRNLSNRFSRAGVWAGILIASSFVIAILWINYTGYVEEDAFITFRFARQIASGNGFVYNSGEPVYGTTTPLLTLLLAGWLKYFSTDIVLGARLLGLFAFTGTLFFTWQTLRFLHRSTAEQLFPLAAILFSSKMLHMNTQGMEMPLVAFLMAASWYACASEKMKWAGLISGLLLWTRVDLIFWPATLVIVSGIRNLKNAKRMILFAGLTYLPWIVFASLYFGSPIPHTITAKWVAYSQFNQSPLLPHLIKILNYLSPFYGVGDTFFLGSLIILSVILWAVWRGAIARERMLLVLIIFITAEITRLTLTRATFFSRYFVPLLWAALVLFGVGLGALWNVSRTARDAKFMFNIFLSATLLIAIGSGLIFARDVRTKQIYRFDRSLKEIGFWLSRNSSPQSTILLEPLGYVGFYSHRWMIDEVGLVTPAVVELKRQGIGSEAYLLIFNPDYIILHCDDALRLHSKQETGLAQSYTLSKEFNPLFFNPSTPGRPPDPIGLVRDSCYQIWQRNK